MSEPTPAYHVHQPETIIVMGRAPELWTAPITDIDPQTYNLQLADPQPAPIPEINRLLDLLAQLPEGLDASSRETNHFELVNPHDGASYWWLDIGQMLHHAYTHNPHTYGQTLDRLQLLLDLAVAAKAAEPWLRYRSDPHLYVNPPDNST